MSFVPYLEEEAHKSTLLLQAALLRAEGQEELSGLLNMPMRKEMPLVPYAAILARPAPGRTRAISTTRLPCCKALSSAPTLPTL